MALTSFEKRHHRGKNTKVIEIDIGYDPPVIYKKYIWGRKRKCLPVIKLFKIF